MQTQVIQVLHLLEMAGNIAVDAVDGWSFKGAEPSGEADCQVAHLSRTDAQGQTFNVILTDCGIAEGRWEGETFLCVDHEGDRIALDMSVRTALTPASEEGTRFYYMADTGLIAPLPQARTYTEAFEQAPASGAWVFSHSGLLMTLASACKALAGQEQQAHPQGTVHAESPLQATQA